MKNLRICSAAILFYNQESAVCLNFSSAIYDGRLKFLQIFNGFQVIYLVRQSSNGGH